MTALTPALGIDVQDHASFLREQANRIAGIAALSREYGFDEDDRAALQEAASELRRASGELLAIVSDTQPATEHRS